MHDPFGIPVQGITVSASALPGIFENISSIDLKLTWFRPQINNLASEFF
jgi:hypothetical protein